MPIHVVHETHCPEIGPICEVRDEPPHLHDLSIHTSELRLTGEYGLLDHLSAEVQIPLRLTVNRIVYRRLDGTELQPSYPNIHHRNETLFGIGELMKQTDYPEGRRVGAFYAQSVSVVDFLVKKKDAVTFTRFVRLGLASGYEAALERYYGYRSFAEMEKDWIAHAFGGDGVASVTRKR